MTAQETYTVYVAVAIFVFCSAALLVLGAWSFPKAVRVARQYRGDYGPAAVYARWRVLRTCVRASQLFFFLIPVGLRLTLPEGNDIRNFGTVTSLFVVALSIALMELWEVMAQKRVEGAIRREGASGAGKLRRQMDRVEEKQDQAEALQREMDAKQEAALERQDEIRDKQLEDLKIVQEMQRKMQSRDLKLSEEIREEQKRARGELEEKDGGDS